MMHVEAKSHCSRPVRDQGVSVADAARRYGVSRRWVHELLRREAAGGLAAVEPRSKRPLSNPRRTSGAVSARILALREELQSAGLDAGPVTIAWHLEREDIPVPSTSTIRRILHNAGLITPEPKKRPKASLYRFEAHQPNETWQSDFTHWALADGTDIEILNFLDDHSRYLLACTGFKPVTVTTVVSTFLACAAEYGLPASTLTDNGMVYTNRLHRTQSSTGRSQTRRPLAPPHRPGRPVRETHLPPRRPTPPHRHRPRPRPKTRPDAHPRRRRHHQRRHHRRDHPRTHHRPHQELPTQKKRAKKNTPVRRPGCNR
jgi:transposase